MCETVLHAENTNAAPINVETIQRRFCQPGIANEMCAAEEAAEAVALPPLPVAVFDEDPERDPLPTAVEVLLDVVVVVVAEEARLVPDITNPLLMLEKVEQDDDDGAGCGGGVTG
jgi:hypothetical protein